MFGALEGVGEFIGLLADHRRVAREVRAKSHLLEGLTAPDRFDVFGDDAELFPSNAEVAAATVIRSG